MHRLPWQQGIVRVPDRAFVPIAAKLPHRIVDRKIYEACRLLGPKLT